MKKDIYQKRYEAHQKRKKDILLGEYELERRSKRTNNFFDLVIKRQSQRIFNKKKINHEEKIILLHSLARTPSSCNRQAVSLSVVEKTHDKKKLEELLVGGAGWISGANIILLLFADMRAYKSPAEVNFMPYLDAGFMGMTAYYAAEALNIGCTFCNPNIRIDKKNIFDKMFNRSNHLFCGAIALGNYDKRANPIEKSVNIFYKNVRRNKEKNKRKIKGEAV